MFAVVLAVTLAFQWSSRAYDSEFGTIYPNEAPHYVNGLLVERYIDSLIHDDTAQSPLSFATSFYLQYPKVSIGYWPPAFYVVEAAWMMIASESKTAMIALSGVMTALLATLLGLVIGRRYGWIAGLVGGVVFAMALPVRNITMALMVDVPLALMTFAATLIYIRYLSTPKWRYAALFGVTAAAAIMLKGNA
ncbi:MAG: glycosyltransferase family 39 protein, partial [Roseiarcus sp.]